MDHISYNVHQVSCCLLVQVTHFRKEHSKNDNNGKKRKKKLQTTTNKNDCIQNLIPKAFQFSYSLWFLLNKIRNKDEEGESKILLWPRWRSAIWIILIIDTIITVPESKIIINEEYANHSKSNRILLVKAVRHQMKRPLKWVHSK